jgi:hypothetical protein
VALVVWVAGSRGLFVPVCGVVELGVGVVVVVCEEVGELVEEVLELGDFAVVEGQSVALALA